MKVSQPHAKAAFAALPVPQEQTPYPFSRDWMILKLVWTFLRKENYFSLPGFERVTVQHVTWTA
jgi:hypothetical protein